MSNHNIVLNSKTNGVFHPLHADSCAWFNHNLLSENTSKPFRFFWCVKRRKESGFKFTCVW